MHCVQSHLTGIIVQMTNQPITNIIYSTNKDDLRDLEIESFFVGWPKKPSKEMLRKSIVNADFIAIAIDKKK